MIIAGGETLVTSEESDPGHPRKNIEAIGVDLSIGGEGGQKGTRRKKFKERNESAEQENHVDNLLGRVQTSGVKYCTRGRSQNLKEQKGQDDPGGNQSGAAVSTISRDTKKAKQKIKARGSRLKN